MNPASRIARPLRAFHGTPHEVEAFCLTRVGTGEGNQTFGFGLYFAQNVEVARFYQLLLAEKFGRTLEVGRVAPTGNLYTVEIHRGKDEFLDWDKPLAAQSRFVRERLREAGVARDYRANRANFSSPGWTRGSETRGHNLYGFLSWRTEAGTAGADGDRGASRLLSDAGIAGIRYLDQGSRGRPGHGTLNLVLFGAEAVLITHRNGLPVSPQGEHTQIEDYESLTKESFGVAAYMLEQLVTKNSKAVSNQAESM